MKLQDMYSAVGLIKEHNNLALEVLRLKELGKTVANENTALTISIGKKKEKPVNTVMRAYTSIWSDLTDPLEPKQEEPNGEFDLNDVETLTVIGALLTVKQERLKSLTQKLLELGVKGE